MRYLTLISLGLACAASTALACPDWEKDPNFGTINLEANFEPDPYVVETLAGGDIDVSNCVAGTIGLVTSEPDFDIFWSGTSVTGVLSFSFSGDGDATLLINTPNGSWVFNDDSDGYDPSISIANPEEGLYSVWIGTHDANMVQGKLSLSEM